MWTPSHVRVTVVRARNILGKGKNGNSDPFVVIQLKKEKFHTSVKEMTLNPEWHEECDLTIPDGRSDIVITILHRNIIGIDLFLGEITLPLSDLDIYERPKSRWFTLESKASKRHKPAKDRGAIELKLEFIVKDVPQASTPLTEKKTRTSSLINLASDVGSKLNSKLPMQRLSLKLGKKNKKSNESFSSRNSFSEEDSSVSSSRPDLETMPEDDQFDFEPSTPTLQVNKFSKFGERSQSVSLLPVTAMQCSPAAEQTSNDWNKLFGSKAHVQSMEDIRNADSLGKKERSGSLSNLRSTRPGNFKRRNTDPSHTMNENMKLSENNNSQLNALRKPEKLEKRKSNPILKTCLEHEPLITLNHSSKISKDILEKYGALNREELLNTIVAQKLVIENQRNKIKDMESYIDNLVVRVMNAMPKLLHTPITPFNGRSSS